MSEETTLQLEPDGKSNLLRIHRGGVDGVDRVVVDFCGDDLDAGDADIGCLNDQHVLNRIAQSTDFICSYTNCSYHHKSESRYILHARSHFVFEISPDAAHDTVFKFAHGKYTCSKCPRCTTDWISFREHIRHHIFYKPYKCSLCMTAVSSVPELRIHFQKSHVGVPADFVFSGSAQALNALLYMLLPECAVVKKPLKVDFTAPANSATRIHGTPLSGHSPSISLLRHLLTSNRSINNRSKNDKQEPCRKSVSLQNDSQMSVKEVPGKYEYNCGVYKCTPCGYSTCKEFAFSHHVYKHIHGWKSTCTHNTSDTPSKKCAVVNGLIQMLKAIEESRVTDSLSSDIISQDGTEADDHSEAVSDAPENASHPLLTENSKYYVIMLIL